MFRNPRRCPRRWPRRWALAAIFGCGAACGDLIPERSDVDTRVVDTAIDAPEGIDMPDIGVVSCETDSECAAFSGCCLDAVCRDNVCMPSYVRGCCTAEGQCLASTDLLKGYCGALCEADGCIESMRLALERCDETLYQLAMTEEGMAELIVDDPLADRLAWHLSRERPFAGGASLRAGDVLCPSYHAGPLSASCAPAGEGGPVRLVFDTPLIALPADVAALVELWVYADLPASNGLVAPLDGLEMYVIPEGGVPVLEWSTRRAPLPARAWTPVLLEQTFWAGQRVQLRFVFETLDGRDNHYEGISLGRVRMRTACADDRIAPDRSACEVAHATEVVGLQDPLMVFGPPEPASACVPCASAETCPRTDTCDSASCEAERCVLAHEVTEACCTADARWPPDVAAGSFEGPLPEGWSVSGSWAPSAVRGLIGESALHFGTTDGSAIAPPGESAAGEALAPPLAVPNDAARWRFSLWLGTEWDAAPSDDNPLGVDLLSAIVLVETSPPTALVPVVAWDSRAIGGTTRGEWIDVTIDLTPWRGRVVRLGWRFQTGDAEANDGEGVWIDGAVVFRECPGCAEGNGRRSRYDAEGGVAPGCEPGAASP